MDEYFTSTLTKLNTHNYVNLTVVIGNESCDLDSAVSSIVYAVFLNWQYNQIRCSVCTKANRPAHIKDDIFIPILNVNRDDYELKTEVAFLLRQNNIYESNLIFRDDHNLKELLSNPTTSSVVLVDHHNLAKRDQFLAPMVTDIIDHRPLNKSIWSYKDDTRTIMALVGSCCTLVTERIRDLGNLVAKASDFFNAYPVCSKLLHATIILDTVNFSVEADKGTPLDEEMVLYLESMIKPSDFKTERKRVFDELVAARSDVSSLTTAQLLKKDVKIVGTALVPSFPLLVKDFLRMPNALKSVDDALSRQGCTLALLLGMDLMQGLQRDVAVYSPNNQTTISFGNHLEQWNCPRFDLTQEIIEGVSELTYYRQRNLAASRKQYIPAVTAFNI